MPEETVAASAAESVEEKPCSSSAPKSATDVTEEAKKLIGTGNRHLVMGDVVSAVGVFQEACAMLAEKFGDTADECGEAFFLCGKSLLELARMENSVLGNALEGVPEESSEEAEKQNDSKIESADNLDERTRDELREQVYDAMSEENRAEDSPNVDKERPEVKKEVAKDLSSTEGSKEAPVQKEPETPVTMEENTLHLKNQEKQLEHPTENAEKASEVEKPADNGEAEKTDTGASATADSGAAEVADDKAADNGMPGIAEEEAAENGVNNKVAEKSEPEECGVEKKEEQDVQGMEEGATDEKDEPMEEDARDEAVGEGGEDDDNDEGDNDDNDDDDEEEGKSEKENEEDVGNLQLAWEMLEVAKVIYNRKESIEDQLMAAQIFLKLGEVGAESGNYSQALEDFQECLAIQLKHLSAHSRLLAETHYQLGTTFSYTGQYSQAIQHFTSSIKVIESRLAMLQEAIDKAEGDEAAKEEKRELEELKQLLPEIAEKVEDAKESQRTAAAASEAILQTLGGASTSSGFPAENGSTSTASQIAVKTTDGATTSKSASDISHLVRKKRKPEDESPKMDSDAKKVKQETTVNGSGNSNGIQEKMEQEVVNPATSEETST